MHGTIAYVPAVNDGIRNVIPALPDWMDTAAVVRLVEGEFDPLDKTTWPAPSAAFAGKTSGSPVAVNFDAASEKWFIVVPEPVGGWIFTAGTVTDTVTISGFIAKTAGGEEQFAALIAPIAVTETGQTITLPYLAAELPNQMIIVPDMPVAI